MVGNALHIFGNHQIVNILGYVLRFLLHYSGQMLTHFGKVIVYLIIGSNNLIGQLQIIFADGADAVVHHLAHNLQHIHKVIRQRHRILFNQLQGVLADVAAMVGNTLHVAH